MSDIPPGNEPTLGNQYLSNIPEADRPIVEKYISEWDKQVTQKFQSIHDEYKPYKEIGADIETLAGAYQLFQYIDQNPQAFYEYLGEELTKMAGETTPTPAQPAPNGNLSPSEFENIPPELLTKLDQQGQMLEGVAKWVADEQAARTKAEEDRVLNDYLKGLHDEHGDFDEDYVLAKLYRGVKAEDAIKAFNDLTQKNVSAAVKNQASVPPFLSSGSVPATTVDPKTMTRNEAKQLFVEILKAGQQQGS